MRILLAPDKFKQTLTQHQAVAAMAEGVLRALPDAEVRSLPMADGGEGTLSILVPDRKHHLEVPVVDPLGAPRRAACARTPEGIGYVEMSLCSGLTLLLPDRLDALRASSKGTGQAIVQLSRDADEVWVGIGGSASTDGGTGAARALGYRFRDRGGDELPEGGGALVDLGAIEPPEVSAVPVVGLCDVMVPLTGPAGAAHGFASQKGAPAEDVLKLEEGLLNLAALIQRDLGVAVETLPGAGAGGGMGAGLVAFFGATLVSGASAVADEIGLGEAIAAADLVITGEGRLDEGTLGNKTVAEVARRAAQRSVPVIAVCGQVEGGVDLSSLGLRAAFAVADHTATAPADDPSARLAASVAAALESLRSG